MSDMLEVMSMMAAPAAILMMLRGYVIRQNWLAGTAERIARSPIMGAAKTIASGERRAYPATGTPGCWPGAQWCLA